jgi:hypothetical protein
VSLEELLRDRSKLLWIVWIAFWSSIVLMAIGFYYIIQDVLG